MKKTESELINEVVDVLSECSMIYFDATSNPELESISATDFNHEKFHTNFYECLLTIISYFLDEDKLPDIYDEKIVEQLDEKLQQLETDITENEMTSEAIRRALLLLDIQGFKNLNFDLDLITPDSVCVIMAELIKTELKNKKVINLIDPNIGIGNLAYYLDSNLEKEINLVGFDNHELMAKVVSAKAEMLQIPLELYTDDCLSVIPTICDCIVSDVACYEYENENYKSYLYDHGVRYFPYLFIEHFLEVKHNVKQFIIINNDFFDQMGTELFREVINNKGNIEALIYLPASFFQPGQMGKSILIIDNNPLKHSTEAFMLPSISDKEKFLTILENIKKYLINYNK